MDKKNIYQMWEDSYFEMHPSLFQYKSKKSIPSKWVEETIVLSRDVSRFPGRYKYDLSPYAREIIDRLHPSDPSRVISIMKGAQSGITQGVIVPGMAWIISENPDSFLFTASDKDIAKKTIDTRFDPIMKSSGLSELIRPNVVRSRNQRTGDTSFSKEFAGGQAVIEGTKNAGKFRFFSVKTVFMDDFDNAPKTDKAEGSIRKLVQGRQTSYGNLAKTIYCSTPTTTQESNIYEVFLLGDQRKWHWPCPHCGDYIPTDWQIKLPDNQYAGIVWKLDENNKLIKDSIGFKCPSCLGIIKETQKYDLNLKGMWIATVEPKNKYNVSYSFNSIVIPPGFVSWETLVDEWLEAVPPKGKVNVPLLQTFNNIHLGLPFEESGETPKVLQIMKNTRDYSCGIIPDNTSEKDGNGGIALITLAADLGGIMEEDNLEDVRIDWEIVAHSSSGATYSIDQGKIGTFKRGRTKTKEEIDNDSERKKWTYMHGMNNSVWPVLREIINKDYLSESGEIYNIKLSLIDTGHFTSYAYQFIDSVDNSWVYGIKGISDPNFRKINTDTSVISPSKQKSNLYLGKVNVLKDELASYMKLKMSDNGYQPPGFMNFPQPSEGKYIYRTFFKHFESEVRREVKGDNDISLGFRWDKKNSSVENHFWDVRIYNLAAKYIFLDLIKKTDPSKYRNLDWVSFVELIYNT